MAKIKYSELKTGDRFLIDYYNNDLQYNYVKTNTFFRGLELNCLAEVKVDDNGLHQRGTLIPCYLESNRQVLKC